jgi:hypothetical protein
MMISEKLAAAMSTQVGRELAASHQYVAIATYFEREMLAKLAGFFYRQAAEEHEHAMKFVHYVTGAGGQAVIPAVDAPRHDINSAEMAAKLGRLGERGHPPDPGADGPGSEGERLPGARFPAVHQRTTGRGDDDGALLKVIQRRTQRPALFRRVVRRRTRNPHS